MNEKYIYIRIEEGVSDYQRVLHSLAIAYSECLEQSKVILVNNIVEEHLNTTETQMTQQLSRDLGVELIKRPISRQEFLKVSLEDKLLKDVTNVFVCRPSSMNEDLAGKLSKLVYRALQLHKPINIKYL